MKKFAFTLLLLHASAFADTWECVDAGDGHVYRATQSVPVDKCTLVSKTPESEETKKIRAMFNVPLAERTTFPKIGMRSVDVMLSRWGMPEKVNKTTTAQGVREQWVYGVGKYLYFDNEVLTAIQE